MTRNTTTFIDQVVNYIKNPFTSYQIDKAKRGFRKLQPKCYVCGAKKSNNGNRCDVHHLVPVHVNPALSCDYNNFITLCRRHHYYFGHCNRSWKVFDSNLFDTIKVTDEARKGTMKAESVETYYEQKGSSETQRG